MWLNQSTKRWKVPPISEKKVSPVFTVENETCFQPIRESNFLMKSKYSETCLKRLKNR